MPRKTAEEVIADLEAKLADAKAKAEERDEASKAKEAEAKQAKIERLDERITKAKEREQQATAYVAKLQAERDELTASDQAPATDPEQPSLPEVEPVEVKSGKRRADAA